MGFKCGIVGLPNVGKSTLFNALTKAGIGAENFPFCTVEPNTGVVTMPDSRLNILAEIVKPKRVIATTMKFVDIAGLVEGASRGEGLGNKFLSKIREVDAIAHVVRCFEDENVIHVSNHLNPKLDIEVINLELILSDIESINKQLLRTAKNAKSGNKEAIVHKAFLESVKEHLEKGLPARSMTLSENQKKEMKLLHLLTIKPTMYISNVAEDGFENNFYLDQVNEIAKTEGAMVVPICNQLEAEISELNTEKPQEFLNEMGMNELVLNRIIHAGYLLLDLQTYFTAGVKEVRAWTIKQGATAPQAAGVIHTDFEKGFIRAEVISYNDFIQYKGEKNAKEAGKWRSEGKEYIVNDGDVMHFRFNV